MMKSFSHIIHATLCILPAGLSLFLMTTSCIFDSNIDDSVEEIDITIVQKQNMTKAISVGEKEQNVQSVRAVCFWQGNQYMTNSFFASQKYLLSTETPSYRFTIPDVPIGEKYLLVMANEPSEVTPYLESSSGYAPDITSAQINLSDINSDPDELLPMSYFENIFVEAGARVDVPVIRSVAKVELSLRESQGLADEGITVRIPAGSNIILRNAMTNTAFVDRGRGTPAYGDISRDITDDIVMTTDSSRVFSAYIGDYENADIRNLELEFKLVIADAGGVSDTRSYRINIGNPDQMPGGSNDVIFRNNIYRISAEVSNFGNVIAEVIDWDTDQIMTRRLAEFDYNVSTVCIPWGTVRYNESLKSYLDFWTGYRMNLSTASSSWINTTMNNDMGGFN